MNNKAEYTPEKVVDISNLSREDWLEYRKKGIGGSDVAAIMGISPFATIRDLFYNKTGVQPVIQEEEESNWVAKEVGHRLEDLVAEIFSKKTGLEVFPVRVMFRHPLYPFMLADVDFFVRMPDGTFAIRELIERRNIPGGIYRREKLDNFTWRYAETGESISAGDL